MGLNILIVGVGVAGPALASLLLRTRQGHNITIIERARNLRVAGAQIDLKHQGVPIIQRMGLMDAVRKHAVGETGLEIVDSKDKVLMSMGVSPADGRGFTLTSEYEIMRGDLVRILYDDSIEQASRAAGDGSGGELEYRFDTTIADLSQDQSKVNVKLSDDSEQEFDLVIAADGQRSRTRSLAFGSQVSDAAFKPLGIHAAYWTMPRIESEGGLARMCVEPGRGLLTRTSNRPVTGANIFATSHTQEIRESYSTPVGEQKQAWLDLMKGSVWQGERLKEGLRRCDDFYAHEQGQVKMPTLFKGSVVLVGDAGYCPSPFTGLGTTLALGGAYTLVGELSKHGKDVNAALKAYENAIRPLVAECQQLTPGGPGVFFPATSIGVWVLQAVVRTMSMLQVDKLMNRWMTAGGKEYSGWVAAKYPELHLDAA